MNGFFVTISNDLLEDKHYENMGNAVWLYMWLIDKMTDISEGQGIVNYGNPITYELIKKNFTTLPRRTYQRMMLTLVEAGYINTMRAPHGLYITVNKAKKQFNKKVQTKSDVPKVAQEPKKRVKPSAKSGTSDVPKVARRYAKSGTSIYKELQYNNNTNLHTTNVVGDQKSPAKKHKEIISKLYYEAIKALDLPVRNHNNVKAKIAEMARDPDKDKITNYLTFMRDQYGTLEWEYKPHISEALDIFNKRGTIRDTFKKHVTSSKESAGWRPKSRGAR